MRWRRVKRPWLRVPPLALAALVVCGAASASNVRIVGVDLGGYPDVRVSVVAPPGSRQPQLRENGVGVTGLRAVDLGAAKAVVLAVDRSQSMRGNALVDAVAGARAFLDAKGAADRISLVAFGHTAKLVGSLPQAADTVPGTALWDAVVLAAQRLAHDPAAGRVIIVLTDGRDVSSVATFADAVAAAQRAKASVYPIGIAGPDFTPGPLQALARRTGGSYHEAASTSQLGAIYASIGRDLARTWSLGYLTTARPGDTLHLTAVVPGGGIGTDTVVVAGGVSPLRTPPSLLPASTWAAPWMPYAVAGIVGALLLLACALVFSARKGSFLSGRLEPHLGRPRSPGKARRRHGRERLRRRVVLLTERMLANVKQFRALQRLLERADLPLRAAELVYICAGAAFFFGLLGTVAFGSPLMTLLFAALGGALPIAFVRHKARVRIKRFDNQLPDLLITISASLKAGHSFRHAIQAVVDEGAQPTAKEFGRVLSETQLGAPVDQALADMATRVGSKNLSFVMTAVTIQRQVGGSLAGLFDGVAETVRQRQHFARKVQGLTAMGRMSAYVLIGLPFFIALAVTLLNPTYMSPLYHTSTGHMLIVGMLAMIGLGSVVLKKMVSFRG
ncbi:MAG: type II secretion system F family protein [Actinobacteria bacterium]|nr:type II secretion system F family protein [Actinomycetota bacterium]